MASKMRSPKRILSHCVSLCAVHIAESGSCYPVFPAGKSVAQLILLSDGKRIFLEGVYPFNHARTPPRFLTARCALSSLS